MRVEAQVAIVTISIAILAMTHPYALRASSSLSWSPWSPFQGRPKEFFERVSDVLRGCLLGGAFGGAYCALSLELPTAGSIVIGMVGGVICSMLARRVLSLAFGRNQTDDEVT